MSYHHFCIDPGCPDLHTAIAIILSRLSADLSSDENVTKRLVDVCLNESYREGIQIEYCMEENQRPRRRPLMPVGYSEVPTPAAPCELPREAERSYYSSAPEADGFAEARALQQAAERVYYYDTADAVPAR